MDRTARVQVVAILVGVLAASALVWQTSGAAFTASTSESGDFSTGTVTLTDDDAGSTSLTVTDWIPGDSTEACVTVDYGGSVDLTAPATFAVAYSNDTVVGDGLADNLDIVVQTGTAGSDCTDPSTTFTADGSPIQTDLASLQTAGAQNTAWTPTTTDTTRPFLITVTLNGSTGNDAQGERTTATFTWAVTT